MAQMVIFLYALNQKFDSSYSFLPRSTFREMYRRAIIWIVIALVFAGMTIPPLIKGILSHDSQCTGIITARAWLITHSILYILFFTFLLRCKKRDKML